MRPRSWADGPYSPPYFTVFTVFARLSAPSVRGKRTLARGDCTLVRLPRAVGASSCALPSTPWEGPVSASIQNFDIAADGVFVEGLEGYIDFSMAQLRAGAAPRPFICQAEPCSWLYSVYDLFAFEYDEDPLDRSRACLLYTSPSPRD